MARSQRRDKCGVPISGEDLTDEVASVCPPGSYLLERMFIIAVLWLNPTEQTTIVCRCLSQRTLDSDAFGTSIAAEEAVSNWCVGQPAPSRFHKKNDQRSVLGIEFSALTVSRWLNRTQVTVNEGNASPTWEHIN